MKKIIAFLISVIMLTSGFTVFATDGEISEWAKDGVEKIIETGIIPEEMRCDYQEYITREELAVISVNLWVYLYNMDPQDMVYMYNYVRHKEVSYDSFTDISDSKYTDYIYWANAMGLVKGRGNGIFDPYSPITREEAAKVFSGLLMNYLTGVKLDESSIIDGLEDYDEISTWARSSVRVMKWSGVMQGTSKNVFSPKGLITKEQCYLSFYRMYRLTDYRNVQLASFEKMVADIEGNPDYEIKYSIENEYYKIIYCKFNEESSSEWRFWIIYKNVGRRNVMSQFEEDGETLFLREFSFDDTGKVLYCTSQTGVKYQVDCENARVMVVE